MLELVLCRVVLVLLSNVYVTHDVGCPFHLFRLENLFVLSPN